MIVQSGKYNDLVESGLDFKALVDAHETSMELVEEAGPAITSENSPKLPQSSQNVPSNGEANGEDKSEDQSKTDKESLKLIKDEERETGRVSFQVYKQYCTEAYGWWGVAGILLLSVAWQGSIMASDYWLAYETSEEHARSFSASLFITNYSIIAAVSVLLIVIRSFAVTLVGLKTAQIFFGRILHSLLHAPMSFFDTTPSGRILSRVRIQRLK